MSAEQDLTAAYQEWRHWAEAEGQAITAGDWPQVSSCQGALRQLQARITRLTPLARAEWSRRGGDTAVKEAILNATIHELIELARRHQALLIEKKEAARRQREQLDQVVGNLKKIRRSYDLHRPAYRTSFA